MNRRLIFWAIASIVLTAGWLLAAEQQIIGSWDCTTTTPMGTDMKWTLTVKEENGKLTGIAGSDEGEMPISDAKLEGAEFTFKVYVNSEPYAVKLKVNGSQLQGTWSGGGETGVIKGTKRKI